MTPGRRRRLPRRGPTRRWSRPLCAVDPSLRRRVDARRCRARCATSGSRCSVTAAGGRLSGECPRTCTTIGCSAASISWPPCGRGGRSPNGPAGGSRRRPGHRRRRGACVALVAARLGTASESGEVLVERDGVTTRSPARFRVVASTKVPPTMSGHQPCCSNGSRTCSSSITSRCATRLSAEPTPQPCPLRARGCRTSRSTMPCVEALCATALALGVTSMRASLFAPRAARGDCGACRH